MSCLLEWGSLGMSTYSCTCSTVYWPLVLPYEQPLLSYHHPQLVLLSTLCTSYRLNSVTSSLLDLFSTPTFCRPPFLYLFPSFQNSLFCFRLCKYFFQDLHLPFYYSYVNFLTRLYILHALPYSSSFSWRFIISQTLVLSFYSPKSSFHHAVHLTLQPILTVPHFVAAYINALFKCLHTIWTSLCTYVALFHLWHGFLLLWKLMWTAQD